MNTITTATPKQAPPASSLLIPTAAWFGTQRGVAQPVPLTQYDDSLPVLAVALYLNGQPYTVPEGAAINVRMDKRDGHYIYNPAYGVSDDRKTVYVAITLQMTTGAGEYWPILELVVDGDVAGTSVLPLHIAKNPVPEEAVESTDEYKTIQRLAEEVQQAAQIVTDNESAIQAIGDNVEAITTVSENIENISAVGGSLGNVNSVAENLTDVQTAAQNITAIQQAPTAAANAAASATLAESWAVGGTGTREGEDTNNAKYWCNQAQTIAQGALGWYETEQALQAAHPTGQNGQWAIIGSTDTIWTWDSDTSAWVDSGAQMDLSNYYTKEQANAAFATTSHANAETTYGAATGSLYGHVKLADTASASGASAGVAATPKCVQDTIAPQQLTPTFQTGFSDAGATRIYKCGNVVVCTFHVEIRDHAAGWNDICIIPAYPISTVYGRTLVSGHSSDFAVRSSDGLFRVYLQSSDSGNINLPVCYVTS